MSLHIYRIRELALIWRDTISLEDNAVIDSRFTATIGLQFVLLNHVYNFAWPEFNSISEKFGAVSEWRVTRLKNPAASLHEWVFCRAQAVLGWLPLVLSVEAFDELVTRNRDEIAWGERQGSELLERVTANDLGELLEHCDIIDHHKVRAGLEQECFRVWHAHHPQQVPSSERLNIANPHDRELMLSPAERTIIDVISAAGSRMTTREVLDAIEVRNGVASEGTTKTVLSGLVRRKILTNRQDVKPKGYGLSEWA